MNPTTTTQKTKPGPLDAIQKEVIACMQCGTCTGSCPNAFAMDVTPRHMWRLVLMGKAEEIFESKTFMMCSSCYSCTLRCPRGLPLTEMMAALKRYAAQHKLNRYKQSWQFYESFMDSVRRHGRVREMEFMSLYFFKMKSPLLPLKFSLLGMKLIGKRKIPIENPFVKTEGKLAPIFQKVRELEETP